MLNLNKKEIIFGVIVGLIVAFCLTGLLPGSPLQLNKSREIYKQAKKYQNNNDFQAAYDTYNKISSSYPAYNMVLFQESKCAASLENERTAIEKLKTIISDYKDSPIAALASYNLAQAYIRIKKNHKAEKQFAYTIENFPKTNFAIGSYYYLGELNQKSNPKLTQQYWIKYISLSPDGRFSHEILHGIVHNGTNFNTNDKLVIGIALFENNYYRRAYNFLSAVPLNKSWYYLAKSCERLGDHKTALSIYKTGILKYSSSFDESKIEESMRAIVKLNGKSAIDSWSDIIGISSKGKDFAFYNKAQLVPYKNAETFYNGIIKYFPHGDYASESLWKLFWHEFNKGNYQQAISLGRKHIDLYTNKKASPKIMFWTAKAYERTDNKHLASVFYNKVLEDYPDSYYAFRASGILKSLHFGSDNGWKSDNTDIVNLSNTKSFMPYSYNEFKDKYGVEVAELASVEDFDMLTTLNLKDPFIDSWIKFRSGVYSKSIVLARDGMNDLMPKPKASDNRWKLIYQIHFKDVINQYSNINNVNPYITLSLTKEESYFNPLAISSSNARGLMQLLPGTASDIARWKKLGSINSAELFNPAKNIQFGTAYLGQIKDLLNNSNLFAVASYNSGPGAVKNWLKSYSGEDMDQFVENIPYDQTRDYVKKVFGSYWNYRRIYKPE